jgi:hypothetical protein
MKFDDLLANNPALRRLRNLDADTLRRLFGRFRGECTWCGNPVGKGRSTWCSQDCVDQFSRRCCTNKSAVFVRRRDGNVCRICGVDIKQQEKEFETVWQVRERELAALNINPYGREHAEEKTRMQEQFCFARGRWSEVDHEIPVVEGGGLCPPEQLRLVCGKCHAKETAELQARLAAKNTNKTSKKKANAK